MADSPFTPLPAPVGTAANPGSAPGGAATPAEEHSTFGNVWRRLAAGAASIPAAPLGIYGMLSEANRYFEGQPLAGGDTANRWNQQYSQWVHENLGIGEPTTLGDRALEIGGSFAVGPASVALRAPALVRGALSTIGGLPQTVRGAAAGTALMTGASELLQPSQAQAAQPPAQSTPTSTVPATVAPQAQVADASPFTPLPRTARPSVSPVSDPTTPASGSPFTPIEQQPDNTSPTGQNWLVAGGLAAGLAILLHRAVRPTPASLRAPTVGPTPATAGATPWHIQQQANIIDATAPVVHAASTMGPVVLDDVRNVMSNQFNPSAQGVQRMHAWTEGRMGNTQLSEAPRVWTNDVSRMSPQSATNLEHIRQLSREIDNRAAGVTTLHTNPVSGVAWGPNVIGEATQEIARLRAIDPVAAQMFDRANSVGRGFIDFAHAEGIITPAERARLTQGRSLLPSIQAEGKQPWNVSGMLERLARVTGRPEAQQDLIRLAGVLRQEGAGPGASFIGTPQTMEATMTALMKAAAHNRARTVVLDHLATPGQAFANVVTRTPRVVQGENLTILRNGVEQHFRVTDPALRNALTVLPDATDVWTGLATRANQVYQAAAAGAGNPAFAIPSLLYNGAMASILRPAGTKVGMFGGDIIGGMAEGLVGAGRGIGALTARTLSQTIDDSLRSNGFLARMLTPNMARQLSTRMAQTWHNSTVHTMQELGAVGIGRVTADLNLPNHFSLLQAANPEFVARVPALSRAWSLYRDALDMVKSGSNIQFFARNRAALGDVKAARMSRQLVGDPSVRGSGKLATGIGTMPFGNVAVQEFAAAGRSIRENPAAFAMRAGIAAAIPAMVMVEGGRRLVGGEREDYFDYLYRRMTPEAASTYMVVPIPGMRPEDMPHIALPNTLRVAYAVARDGYAMLTGVTPEATTERLWANARTGGMSAQPISTPPVLNMLLATQGARFDPTSRGSTTGGSLGAVIPVRGAGASVGEPDETIALPPDASPVMRMLHSTVLNSVVTSIAASAGQTALESARAYAMAVSPQGTGQPLRDAAIAGALPSQRTLSQFGVSDMWGQSRRVSTNNEDGRLLSEARGQMQRINQEFDANVTNQGWAGSRAHGVPDVNAAQLTGVRDPNMRVLMTDANRFSRTLANTELRALSVLRDQQAFISGTPSLNPRERAAARDNIDRQIMERQRETLRQVQNFEYEQSVHWGRRIRLRDISRSRTMDSLPLFTPQQPQ